MAFQSNNHKNNPITSFFVGSIFIIVGVMVLALTGNITNIKGYINGYEDDPVTGIITTKNKGGGTKTTGSTYEESTAYRYTYNVDGQEYNGYIDTFNSSLEIDDKIQVYVGKEDRNITKIDGIKNDSSIFIIGISSIFILAGSLFVISTLSGILKLGAMLAVVVVAINEWRKKRNQ